MERSTKAGGGESEVDLATATGSPATEPELELGLGQGLEDDEMKDLVIREEEAEVKDVTPTPANESDEDLTLQTLPNEVSVCS